MSANNESVNVVLMAGGYGTRLYPLTKDRPKALLPLGQGVILDRILGSVKQVPNLSKTVLVSNHRFFAQFQAWQQAGKHPVEVIDDGTSTPETRLGAIRDLHMAMERLAPAEDVLVLGTDNLFTWSLAEFVQFGKMKRPACAIAIREAPSAQEASRCLVVEVGEQDRLLRCVEKPSHPASKMVGLCIYYFPPAGRRRIEQFIRDGGSVDAPGFFIERLATQEPVYGFPTGGEWFDIGSPESYQEAAERLTAPAPGSK